MTTSTRETTTVERKYRLGDLGRFLDPRLTQLQDNLLRGVLGGAGGSGAVAPRCR